MTFRRPDWPNGTTCIVALTFDNLGESLALLRHGYAGGALSDGVYAPRRGVERVLEVLSRRNIAATFFVEGWGATKYADVVESIVRNGHEIGAHGWMHETWNTLEPTEEAELIQRATDAIESVAKTRPVGWRAPSGLATPRMLELIHDAGYRYDSSFADDDVPYFMGIAPNREETILELPWAWNTDDAAYYAYPGTIARPRDVAAAWIEEFDAAYATTGFFHLLCHPRYTGRPSRIRALETLIDHIAGHDGIAFASCRAIAEMAIAAPATPSYPTPETIATS